MKPFKVVVAEKARRGFNPKGPLLYIFPSSNSGMRFCDACMESHDVVAFAAHVLGDAVNLSNISGIEDLTGYTPHQAVEKGLKFVAEWQAYEDPYARIEYAGPLYDSSHGSLEDGNKQLIGNRYY